MMSSVPLTPKDDGNTGAALPEDVDGKGVACTFISPMSKATLWANGRCPWS